MSQQVQTYRERSREYLAKAILELEAGELTQAAEKGWGAAAQMVKAVADQRGMDHRSHRDILLVAQALARESGEFDMEVQFAMACELHIDFYEDMFNQMEIERRLQMVRQFVERLERLLDGEGRALNHK